MKRFVILLIIFLGICAIPTEAKESICGDLSQIVYSQYASAPKQGCLYAYSKGSLALQVIQTTNNGILVTAKYPYYGGYYTDPKTIYIQTSKQFVDNQIMKDDEIVKYIGIYEYITAFGVKKRVYKFYRYGKYEIERNVDTVSLEKYGFIIPKDKIQESYIVTKNGLVRDTSVGKPRPPKEEWAISDDFLKPINNKKSTNINSFENKIKDTQQYADKFLSNKYYNSENSYADISQNDNKNMEVSECFKQLKIAEDKFKNSAEAIPSEKNDIKFREFLFTYWHTIENINENANDGISQLHYDEANGTDDPKMWSTKAKNLVKYYKQNGVGVSFDEGYFIAVVDKEYLKTFYKYLTPQYIKWLDFDKKIQTEVGIQDNCHHKLYEIVEEGKDYYNEQ